MPEVEEEVVVGRGFGLERRLAGLVALALPLEADLDLVLFRGFLFRSTHLPEIEGVWRDRDDLQHEPDDEPDNEPDDNEPDDDEPDDDEPDDDEPDDDETDGPFFLFLFPFPFPPFPRFPPFPCFPPFPPFPRFPPFPPFPRFPPFPPFPRFPRFTSLTFPLLPVADRFTIPRGQRSHNTLSQQE